MTASREEFDVCIIGAGPAGFAAAMRAWDFGARVCLVERGELGGAAIYNGVLMSKTLWELSQDYLNALKTNRGYSYTGVELSVPNLRAEARKAMSEKAGQMRKQLSLCSSPHPQHGGSITLVQGDASFISNTQIVLKKSDRENEEISAKNFIVATGSRPRLLNDISVDGRLVMTSDHHDSFEELPSSIVIVGAGVVGCEFATILASFGQTKVYLIDRAPRILPFEDEDIAALCTRNLEAKGATIHHGAKLLSLKAENDQVIYTIEHASGAQETIAVASALLSVGRVPNSDGIGLTEIGVKLDAQGYIVNENTQSSVPNIYAVGDVTNDHALVNVGEVEGRYAVEHIYGTVKRPLSYLNLSTIMFLDPEIAAVGLNELQAQQQKIPYRVAVYGYSLVSRAIAMRATGGFVKVLCSDDEEMKLLGMRAVGAHASTAIGTVSLCMQQGGSVLELSELVHPHPAISEALQECIRMLCGTSIYKPEFFQESLRLSRVSF